MQREEEDTMKEDYQRGMNLILKRRAATHPWVYTMFADLQLNK